MHGRGERVGQKLIRRQDLWLVPDESESQRSCPARLLMVANAAQLPSHDRVTHVLRSLCCRGNKRSGADFVVEMKTSRQQSDIRSRLDRRLGALRARGLRGSPQLLERTAQSL